MISHPTVVNLGANNKKRPRMDDTNFADRLTAQTRKTGNPLCLGLDPHLTLLPQFVREKTDRVKSIEQFLISYIDLIAKKIPAVKPQAAFFEQLGPKGMQLLFDVSEYARQQGLLVILDAKRSDIGSTAQAYAQAYLSRDTPFDAITLNPYLGMDSLSPFLEACQANGKGVFILVKTSNPGAKDFQDLALKKDAALYEEIATRLQGPCEALVGKSGWSSLGVVVGATYPEEAVRIRQILPKALFLVPGFGAQGASAQAALSAFEATSETYMGGVISSSRAIMFPTSPECRDDAEWKAGVEAGLEKAIQALSK
jgi:orotidine-5'-phosphate decarboxylase